MTTSPSTASAPITDNYGQVIGVIRLYPIRNKHDSLLQLTQSEADALGEEPVQLIEESTYEYELSESSWTTNSSSCRRSANPERWHLGQLQTGSRCGRLRIHVTDHQGTKVGECAVQVVSKKLEARSDFREMLAEVTEGCLELALDARSTVSARIHAELGSSAQALYQRFAFLRGLSSSASFSAALHQIVARPHVRQLREEVFGSIRRAIRPSASFTKYLARSSNRVPVPPVHPLHDRLPTLAINAPSFRLDETYDTDENRFVKFIFLEWASFATSIAAIEEATGRANSDLYLEAVSAARWFRDLASGALFKDVSHLRTIPHGSPVVQRKAGYREIYQAWLKFELSGLIDWVGVDDFYAAGLRDTAALYEHWTFVRTLRCLQSLRDSKWRIGDLFRVDVSGMHVRLKRGNTLQISGVIVHKGRRYSARLDYNRLFSSSNLGSWSEPMQPDMTITVSLAPLIECSKRSIKFVRVHLDAKYRVSDTDVAQYVTEGIGRDMDTDNDDLVIRHKRDDLIKMHAYRDAIVGSAGAFILFPGSKQTIWSQGSSVLPAVGAIPISPNRLDCFEEFVPQLISEMCQTLNADTLA